MNDAFGSPQSAVVLGGTSDIASVIVARLAARRCQTVVLAGRDRDGLRMRAEAAKAAGAREVRIVDMEATEVARAGDAVDQCFEQAGEVDLVLMAVGSLGQQPADERDPERAAETVTINYGWPVAALTAVARRLEKQGHGRIIVLSSVAGVRVRRTNYLYGSAKAGLDGFAVGLSESLRGSGVTLQVVRPGFVHSKMTKGLPAAPMSTTPDAVADAVIKGLATNQPVIWVPPQLRWVFFALRQLPQAIWRRLPG